MQGHRTDRDSYPDFRCIASTPMDGNGAKLEYRLRVCAKPRQVSLQSRASHHHYFFILEALARQEAAKEQPGISCPRSARIKSGFQRQDKGIPLGETGQSGEEFILRPRHSPQRRPSKQAVAQREPKNSSAPPLSISRPLRR